MQKNKTFWLSNTDKHRLLQKKKKLAVTISECFLGYVQQKY